MFKFSKMIYLNCRILVTFYENLIKYFDRLQRREGLCMIIKKWSKLTSCADGEIFSSKFFESVFIRSKIYYFIHFNMCILLYKTILCLDNHLFRSELSITDEIAACERLMYFSILFFGKRSAFSIMETYGNMSLQ